GPRQNARYGMVLPTFVQQALAEVPITIHGDGKQSRCFCDVRDAVEAVTKLIDARAFGEILTSAARRRSRSKTWRCLSGSVSVAVPRSCTHRTTKHMGEGTKICSGAFARSRSWTGSRESGRRSRWMRSSVALRRIVVC